MFVKLNNDNEIEKYPYTLDMFREENRNVSLPKFLNNKFLETRNIYPVIEDKKPEIDSVNYKLVRKNIPIYEENNWVLKWDILEKTEQEKEFDYKLISIQVREQRDKLLSETDWLVARAFETKTEISEEWLWYRNELRTIPDQEGFPYNINWPQKPIN